MIRSLQDRCIIGLIPFSLSAFLILLSCLIATCSDTVPQGESTGGKEAPSIPSTGKAAPTVSSMKRNDKEELPIEQRVGVEKDPKTGEVRLSFAADVKSCLPIAAGGAAGKSALIVSNDPRYDLVVAVVAAPKGDPLLRRGANVTLAVHSPTLLFGRDFKAAVAKRFIFRLHGAVSDGQRRFFHIDAEEVKAREEPSGKEKGGITPEEARAMILRFLGSNEASKIGSWVTDSRAIVEKDHPSRLRSGDIAVGPWIVDPAKQTVQLAIDRAQLEGSFSRDGDAYAITKVDVTEVRGRH